MGKKSKRVRKSNNTAASSESNIVTDGEDQRSKVAPAVRPPKVEDSENLHFEDPYGDEYEEEDVFDGGEGNEAMETSKTANDNDPNKVVAWNPFSSNHNENEPLEMDASAYKMHHALTPEWPSLSFDFIRDNLGSTHRTRFPHSLIAAIGTQADRAEKNKLTILKLSDLGRVKKQNDDDNDDEWEEYDKDNKSDEDDEDDEEDVDYDPVLEHFSIPHNGGVNRLRCMPQNNSIVATWSDTGKVNIFNTESIVQALEGNGAGSNNKFPKSPFFTYSHHATEGYAMDWSSVVTGQLATGDCQGNIHLWKPTELLENKEWTTSTWDVQAAYSSSSNDNSVEDLQWSPTEATVFASAECGGGYIRIYDTRRYGQAMLSQHISAPQNVDINVIAWNKLVPNLLASGSDDGTFSVWDLRTFSSSNVKPLARFTCHQKPITSLEWHPTDESMIVISDEDGTFIYDLSIEQEDDQQQGVDDEDIPPQLLFVHCGSTNTKENHWHPQISSCIMTTAFSGFTTFIPSNL